MWSERARMSLWRMILTAINLVGLRFGGAALGLLAQVLLARVLPQDEVGVVLMGLSAAAIVSLLMTAGYPSLTMTVLPRYYALGRRKLAEAFHRAVWQDTLAVTAILGVIVLVIYLFVPLDPALRTALVFGCLMAPASSLIRITSSAANSKRRFQLSYIPDFIFRPGLLLLFLGAMWLLDVKPGLSTVIGTIIAITFAVALAQAFILGSSVLPKSIRTSGHDLRPVLRGRAASMVIVAAVAMSFADIVTLLGGLFLPADQVAELGIAIRLAALAGFVTQVTQNFVLPDLTAAIVKNDRPMARSLILRINLIALVAIASCVVVAVFFGPLILSVFGADYTGAHWPLVLFMVSQMFRAAGGMNQHLLSIDGHQARSAKACILSLAVLVAAAFVLTPTFGVMGMALAVIASDVVWAAALGIQAQSHAGYRGDIFAVFSIRKAQGE
jgi:O-antigen/teichoic acid export membrane protein